MHLRKLYSGGMLALFCLGAGTAGNAAAPEARPLESDYVIHDFHFASGETLPELRIHYTYFGKAKKDAQGRVTNAVLIMHGTGGSGRSLINERILRACCSRRGSFWMPTNTTSFCRMASATGNPASPATRLRMQFPQYSYQDMVLAQYLLLTKGLDVNHLRLVMGTSMGCMHTFMWGETYPDFMDALMPLACLPVQIAGRNRLWRDLTMDAIRNDPQWMKGDYTTSPSTPCAPLPGCC